MTTTQTKADPGRSIAKLGLITVKGRARMAFRSVDGRTFYFPHIRAKAVEANVDDAATWEE